MKIILLFFSLFNVVNEVEVLNINHDYLDNQIEIMIDNLKMNMRNIKNI